MLLASIAVGMQIDPKKPTADKKQTADLPPLLVTDSDPSLQFKEGIEKTVQWY